MTESPVALKTCTKCDAEKPTESFHKRALSNDGLMAQCKDCVNSRIRDNYRKDPAKKISKTRQYHLDHPDWSRKTLSEWHQKNKARRYEKVKERLKTDPDFRQQRRVRGTIKERERRAQKAGAPVSPITADQLAEILAVHDNCCWICSDPLDTVHWDHYQPLAASGDHSIDNLRPAHAECNVRKSSLWPFTEDMRTRIAEEVRALRASRKPAGSVTDGRGV